ncbi:MAG: hypothetical protein ACE5HH_03550 [Candidatus Hydrothermarchaeales archaeon]
MVYTDILTFEIAISFVAAGYLSFLVLTKKDALLSLKGKDVIRQNIGTVKLGVFFSLVSMLLYLQAETAEILSILFPSTFNINLRLIHEYSEVLHLFLLIFALLFFLFVLIKVGEESG